MADVSVKMGVSGIAQFKQGMKDAEASVKTLDAAMKANEKSFKATGDAESHLAAQTALLNQKLQQQKTIAKNAEQALKQMEANGVKTTSAAYQNMQRKLIEAQSGMMDTEAELNNLGTKASGAAEKTDQLSTSLGGLNKKISLDQVISAVGRVTDGLERAGQKAIQLGKNIWDELMESARWADDSATMAMMYGVDLDTFLRVQKLVQNGMDTSVEAILKSKSRLMKNVGGGSDSFMATMKELGLVVTEYGGKVAEGIDHLITDDSVELFWKAGQAIMALGEETEQEAKAQELFGKSWRELVPLFTQFSSQEEFDKALENVTVNTEDEVNALAELNDKVGELKGNFDTLENKVLAGLAPALTKAADALSGLLENIIKYLESPEGQEALNDLGQAVSEMFEDLTNVNFSDAINKVGDALQGITNGLTWIKNNWGAVKLGLEGLAVGFGLLKVSEGVLTFMQLINNGKTLFGGGGGSQITPTISGMPVGTAAGADAGTPTINAAQTVLGNSVPAATSGIDTGLGPATTVLEKVLNRATLISMAEAAGKAFDPKNTEAYKGVQELVNSGMTQEEQQRAALIHDFGMTEEEAEMFIPVKPKVDEDAAEETWDEMLKRLGMQECPIEVEEIDVPEDAAEQVAKEVGTVTLPGQIIVGENGIIYGNGGGSSGGHGFANGLPYVPFDGYPALLHKGEQVVPAREVGSRSYSSNMYIESMYMNNGQDAEGLAAAIAAANRRTMRGFGS